MWLSLTLQAQAQAPGAGGNSTIPWFSMQNRELVVKAFRAYAGKAFVLDIGSANSKIAWLECGQPKSLDTYGSKYYEKGLNDAIVATEVKAKANQVPVQLRGTCFIIGGAPYELAKAVRQGQESFTMLHAPGTYSQLAGAKAKAGLNIYQAVAEATGCQQFVFGYDANFTIGHLLSLP